MTLVTGSSRGIGRSIALELAARGVDVVVTYLHDRASAESVAEGVRARGSRAFVHRLDVADVGSFGAFAEQLRNELGSENLDFLVHNGGTGAHASFAETTVEDFDRMLGVHLRGPYFLTQRLLPLIADGGRIVYISTGLTRYTFPGVSAYATMKGGAEVMVRYLARELGARGITANVVAPGGVVTDFGGGVMRDDQLQKMVASQTALGRIAEPEDISGVVAMLLSPETRWLTGQRLEATGGYAL